FYPPVSRNLTIVFALVVSDVVQGAFRHEIQQYNLKGFLAMLHCPTHASRP
ncbi:hypothetical protein EV363DRAFT_1174694, partial [Boletus edulis]